jgi:hypothetical protein
LERHPKRVGMPLRQPLTVWPSLSHDNNLAFLTRAEAVFIEYLFSVAVAITHLSVTPARRIA